ncbi:MULTISPECIES: FUSC family protein [unclassified Psychrobacter]|uniref:FUSC family protein n=1 Tax=unclassified Psychrobacter TaxID=196806 RepID=UPI0019191A25|nr:MULTISPECIES: FUSC family protein [unclassified Psychrobacter]|tara:strand:- start:1252 stop:2463 length:1212 start_codon:yes stop_codon:yes gene_type:complete
MCCVKPTFLQRFTAPVIEPYARYQHADVLHAIRLGVAVILALLVNKVTNFPHGEWTTITVFIILGLLQYQGAIYTKAKERVLGTLLGIGAALGIVWFSQGVGTWLWVDYVIIGLMSGIIGYLAIRNLGYTGLLTGITMLMIVSDLGQSTIGQDGIYRALNILLGTGLAVAATLILPLKSTLMWRFLLASNLDACSNLYARVGNHIDTAEELIDGAVQYVNPTVFAVPVNKALVIELQQINKRLLAVRPHLAATTSESGIDKETIESIQRTHRNIIGTIDLLLTAAPRLASIEIDEDNHILLIHYQHELTQVMQHMAAVLRSPSDEVFRPITRITLSEYPSVENLGFEWQGYFWLTQTLQVQLQQLSDLLQETKPQWFTASGLRYQRREQRRIEEHGGETDLHL